MKRRLLLLLLPFLLLPAARTVHAQPASSLGSALTAFAQGRYADVVALLGTAADRPPEATYLLARAHQELMQHGRAAALFAESDTTEARVLAAWGQSLLQLGQGRAALQRYERAYHADSADQRAALPLARLYAQAERWEAVETIYTRLVQADPGNPSFHAQLGLAYRALGRTDDALAHLERAHRLNPLSVEVPLHLSGLYVAADSLISARRVLERALEAQPEEPLLWRRRGEIALQELDPAVAVAAFRRALSAGDSSAATLRNLGAAYYMDEAYAEALPPLRASARLDSLYAMTFYYLGMTHKHLEQHDRAAAALEKAGLLFGQHNVADVHEALADVYRYQNRYEAAIAADRLALQLNPDKRAVLFHLATLYDEHYADPAPALRYYRQYLERVAGQTLRSDLLVMQAYAQRRIEEIERGEREKRFWQRRPAPPDTTRGQHP